MSTVACRSSNPETCRSPRCPNRTGRATSKVARLSASEQHELRERNYVQAEAVRVDALLATKGKHYRDLVVDFYN